MQTVDMAVTSAMAPYDCLRAMRCRYEFQGTTCSGRAADIDWNRPGTHAFKCPKCKTMNVVHIVEAAR